MIKRFETSFSVNILGEFTGEQFVGKFTVKTRLSHNDRLQQDQIRRNLLGPQPAGVVAGDRALSTSEILSQLQVRVIEAPSWWTNSAFGAELSDDNVIIDIYTEALKSEAAAKKEIQDAAAKAKEELAKETSAE